MAIPITVDGEPVTTTPDDCDHADLKGQCAVGSYLGHLVGQDHDGSPKPEVNWVFFCRRDQNACTSCHRMPDFTRFTRWSGVDYNEHMPPLSPGSMKEDFDAVMACLTEGPDMSAGCSWAALNGATPTKNPPPKD